jgi:hypothetical protein
MENYDPKDFVKKNDIGITTDHSVYRVLNGLLERIEGEGPKIPKHTSVAFAGSVPTNLELKEIVQRSTTSVQKIQTSILTEYSEWDNYHDPSDGMLSRLLEPSESLRFYAMLQRDDGSDVKYFPYMTGQAKKIQILPRKQ